MRAARCRNARVVRAGVAVVAVEGGVATATASGTLIDRARVVVVARVRPRNAGAVRADVRTRTGVGVALGQVVVDVRAEVVRARVVGAGVAVVALGGRRALNQRDADVQLEVVARSEVAPCRGRMRYRQVERAAPDRVLGVEADARVGRVRLLDTGEERAGANGERRRQRDRDRARRADRPVRGVFVDRCQSGNARTGARFRIDRRPVGRGRHREELEVDGRDLGRRRDRKLADEIGGVGAVHPDATCRRRTRMLIGVKIERRIQRPGLEVVRCDVVRGNRNRDGVATGRGQSERRECNDRLSAAGGDGTSHRLNVREDLRARQVERHREIGQRIGALVADDRLDGLRADQRLRQRAERDHVIDARVVQHGDRRRQPGFGAEVARGNGRGSAVGPFEASRQRRIASYGGTGCDGASPTPFERHIQTAARVGERAAARKRDVEGGCGAGERRGGVMNDRHARDRRRPRRALQVGRVSRVLEVHL